VFIWFRRGGSYNFHISLFIENDIGKENIRDQVVPVLVLLQSTESHLGTWDIFLWVLEIFELYIAVSMVHIIFMDIGGTNKSLLAPVNSLLLVGIGVCETID